MAFGQTDLVIVAIIVISALAALSDLIFGKIFNLLTMPALLAGVGYSAWHAGWTGAGWALLAALAALGLYGWLFWLGHLGGGDVKLLMALGAWGGLKYVAEVALLGVAVGGVFAVLALASRGRLKAFMKRLHDFFYSIFASAKLKEFVVEPMRIDRSQTMPFGISIAVAAIVVVVGQGGTPLWK